MSNKSSFADRVVFVTGASSGMGKAAALFLAKKGVRAVTLFARRKERLEETAAEIAKSYPSVKTLVVAGDASSSDDNKMAVQATVEQFGGVDAAFINAGIYRGSKNIEDTDDTTIDELLSINVKGVIYALRHLIPAIKQTVGDDPSKHPAGSIVVNSSSMGAAVIGPKSAGSSIYSATKAFVNSLVETAAIENAPRIRVNAVLPGVVNTEIMPMDDESYDKFGGGMAPLYGRAGRADEIASTVAYLISDEAPFLSGELIKVDGLWSKSGNKLSE